MSKLESCSNEISGLNAVTFPMKQSPTDLDVLIQACRNTRGEYWVAGQTPFGMKWPVFTIRHGVTGIRIEYNRLIRLKKSKKRWKV